MWTGSTLTEDLLDAQHWSQSLEEKPQRFMSPVTGPILRGNGEYHGKHIELSFISPGFACPSLTLAPWTHMDLRQAI